MPGALEGVRVVDFGQYIAGPLAAVMLSDQGADVIHVDPPGGPRWNVDADAFYNRGKRRISLDLAAFYNVYDSLRSLEPGPSPTQPVSTPPPPGIVATPVGESVGLTRSLLSR